MKHAIAILTLAAAASTAAAPALAETLRGETYTGAVTERLIEKQPADARIAQVFVTVTRNDRGAIAEGALERAAAFAAGAGCRDGDVLTMIRAAREAAQVDFELLCRRPEAQ